MKTPDLRSNPTRRPSHRTRLAARVLFDALERRVLMSGSNAIDRIDFGNLAAETAHAFEHGTPPALLSPRGVGSVGVSSGLTYRNPSGNPDLTFNVAVDPVRQNYLSVRVWGNDVPNDPMDMTVGTTVEVLEENGGNVQFPNRFIYYTAAIPIAQTIGKTSIQLTLDAGRPVYSAYTHTATMLVPDSADPAGTKPAVTGEPTLDALTLNEAISILQAKRQSIYNAGGYFDQMLARQVMPGTPGAPTETIGLDLFTDVNAWRAANPSATPDDWRNRIATQKAGPGYTAFPDELLGVLTASYLLQPFTDASGNVVPGLDRYHDPSLITRIVSAIDGASWSQGSNGGFPTQGGDWIGLISSPRVSGDYAGQPGRLPTVHGGGSLQGVDTYALGWTLIQLLNDPTAAPILQSYLGQSYDANLNGGSMLRATAYERMLFEHVNYCLGATGGTHSQNMFQELAMYAASVALTKIQALFPNAAYAIPHETTFNIAKEIMGLRPTSSGMRGVYAGSVENFGMTLKGFGEAHGAISTGYDGGGYGSIIPWLAVRFAQIAAWDPNADAATVNAMRDMASITVDSYDQFLSPLERATVNSSGVVTSVTRGWGAEPYITYRDTKNVNSYANVLEFNDQYLASDPSGVLANAYALRSAYLSTQHGLTARNSAGGDGRSLNYLRDLQAYESTIRSLINVDPATLTPLPAEPGQPDFEWADVQAGAVAFLNNGERFYANLNWRNYEFNNGFTNMPHSNVARVHYTTGTIERAGQIIMPKDAANVQADGNLTGLPLKTAKVLRYGDYLIVLNDGSTAYAAKLPAGIGQAKDLATGMLHNLGANVNVAAGQYAIFWLAASNVVSPVGNSGADIGAVGTAGANGYANGIHTISGAGADIGGAADAFRLVATTVSGDATLVAQVMSQTGSSAAEAGVMIRADNTPGSAFAAVLRSPGNGLRFEYRPAAGATSAWVTVPTPLAQVWVKLTRSGNGVAAYYSTDNTTWTQIGATQTIALPSPALFGLAVSSHNTAATATATFANVSVTPGVAPTVAAPAAASASTVTGTTVNLSALGADNTGEAGLTYTWSVLGDPPAPVSFSTNKTNGAKNTVATFATEGAYTFRVLIADASGAATSSDVIVTVAATPTSIVVTPATAVLAQGASSLLFAAVRDQFGQPLESPPAITWSIDAGGAGSVDATGLYTAPASGSGATTVRATAGALSGTAAVTIQAPVGIFSNTTTVGSPALAGSASHSSGTYTVSAGGNDIWGTSDQFRFVYIPLTGDATITARVASMQNTNTFAKAGVMFRTSLDANSPYALNYVSPNSGTRFEYRNTAGGSAAGGSTGLASGAPPTYIRLTRAGSTISAAYSTDGVNFTTHALTLSAISGMTAGSTVYVGLVVCSHNTGQLNTVTFDNVTITQPATPLPFTAAIGTSTGSSSASGTTASLTSTGGDIWGTADSYQFTYVPITGDSSITARVTSISGSTAAKVGVMIRGSLAAGGQHMSALLNPSGNARYAWRTTAGGNTSELNAGASGVPYWLRVTRAGNSLSAFRSVDGVTWVQIGIARTVTMGTTAYVGLANASLGNATVANYDNISVTGTPNVGPGITTPAAASANPITGTTTTLTVLGADSDAPESNLTYAWDVVNFPPADVTFSANGTNAAKSTVATFTRAGTYTFRATVTDTGGIAVTSFVTVVVNQALSAVVVTPASPAVAPGSTRQFAAVALDQFGRALATQPASFTWSLASGVGSISASGLYSAPQTSGSATVRAASGAINGSTVVTVTNQSPLVQNSVGVVASQSSSSTVQLSVPAVDDTGEAGLTYAWSVVAKPAGASNPTFGANGTNAAKSTVATFSTAGNYTFQVTATDAGGLTTTGSVTINVIGTPTAFTGTAGNDRFYVRRDGGTLQIWVGGAGDGSGAPTHSGPFASFPSLTFDGLDGDDWLTIDGADAVPAGGVAFTGGGDDDALVLKSFTSAPAGAVNFADSSGSQDLTVDGGAFTFASNLASSAGSVALHVVNGATVTLGASQTLAAVSIDNGTLSLPAGASRVLSTGALSVTGAAGRLDLRDNKAIVRGTATGSWSGGAYAGVNELVASARNGGAWNGPGVGTSMPSAPGSGRAALAVASAADVLHIAPAQTGTWAGQTVTGGDTLIMYTYAGDADMNGKINGDDYFVIDSRVAQSGSVFGWYNADFDYNGRIDGDDYFLIDSTIGRQDGVL
ncbi:MAG TPA: hypothetical protein VER17_14890 [Tepidisphaeraceae bacterium]|nr:hypothetical protein [Tepidisphaeraceae bacterium]